MKIDTISRRGMMRALCALADRWEMSFTDLRRLVGSPTTTSKCLRGLIEAGLIKREIQADRYRSVRYSLTEKGAEVAKLVKELEKLL